MNRKFLFLFIASIFFFSLQQSTVFASSKTDTLVISAIKAGNTLRILTTAEKKGNGKNFPSKEYKNALKKYKSAKSAVNKLKGKQKKAALAKLSGVLVQIHRGKHYLDAVSAGKQLNAKKAVLEKYSKKTPLDDKTVNAYNALNVGLKTSSTKFKAVYGSKTQTMFIKLYKTPSEGLIKKLSSAITVKKAINDSTKLAKANATTSSIAAKYKIIVFNMDSITQSGYKSQLKGEVKKLNSSIPVSRKTGSLSNLILIESQLEELDLLLSPGKSNAKVPSLYNSLSTKINGFSKSDKDLLQRRFSQTMSQLKVSIKELKGLLTKAASVKGIPPEVVKAIAVTENGKLQQFTAKGEVFTSPDNGYGIMQVTPLSANDQRYDWNRVKYDLRYNIETGINILLEKWNYAGTRTPIINKKEKWVLENWYFPIMAYNGLSMKNDPNRTNSPYQVKVYNYMKQLAFVDPYVFKKEEVKISVDPLTLLPSFSGKMNYVTTKKTFSTQLFPIGKSLTITASSRFRSVPSTTSSKITMPKGTKLKILAGPIEDDRPENLFNWYKVSITGKKGVWYIASSNLN